jgi:hypothetical protein
MMLTPVKDLGSTELLNEFQGIAQMSGGDLTLSPRYKIRLKAARKELLRRLADGEGVRDGNQ